MTFDPENWLSYHGDQRMLIGALMGPGYGGVGMSTVVAARFDPDFEWPDGLRGRTQLGMVSGDVREELRAELGP